MALPCIRAMLATATAWCMALPKTRAWCAGVGTRTDVTEVVLARAGQVVVDLGEAQDQRCACCHPARCLGIRASGV